LPLESQRAGSDSTVEINQRNVSASLAQELTGLLKSLSESPGVHHAVMAIESLDASTRWSGATGIADTAGTPMSAETPYWIASVTKLFIASATFRLIEQERVTLGDPISSILPESLVAGIHRLQGADYTDMITVQHLLGHSSGLPDFLEESPRGELSLLDRIAIEDQAWTIEDAMSIVREDLTPHFPPQRLDAGSQRIRYSDTNYQLLMAIIEQVTGKTMPEVFGEFIYQPLGLMKTAHPEQLEPGVTHAVPWAGDVPLNAPLAMPCFRDLSSTLDDQILFMRGLLTGQVFERSTTVYQMMGNWNNFPFSLNPAPKSPGWPIQYGLGAMRFRIPRLFAPFRPFPPIMGHTGVTGSWLFYCPDLNLILAGTVDQLEAAATPFRFLPRLLQTLKSSM
jgi:D-alanyl-D-alanine carboxypeptidase